MTHLPLLVPPTSGAALPWARFATPGRSSTGQGTPRVWAPHRIFQKRKERLMKKLRLPKRLMLNREPLRRVSDRDLKEIGAGALTLNSCDYTCYSCDASCACSHFNNNTCNTN